MKEKEKLKGNCGFNVRNSKGSNNNISTSKIKYKKSPAKLGYDSRELQLNGESSAIDENVIDNTLIERQLKKKQKLYECFSKSINKLNGKEEQALLINSSIDFDQKKLDQSSKYIIDSAINLEDYLDIEFKSQEKVLVKQQYEKILTDEVKSALKEIKEEEKHYVDNITLLKKKKLAEREERISKLKSLSSQAKYNI